jgi:hypothetical protein
MSMVMTPQQPLSVTLEAQQWEVVLRLLDEVPAPHRVTDPLMRAIQQQCMAANAQMPMPNLPATVPANGGDERG